MVLPVTAVAGPVFWIVTFGRVIVVVVVEVLSPPSSPGVVVLIVAVLVTLDGALVETVVLTVMLPPAPLPSVPRFQVSTLPATLEGAGLAETNDIPAGRVSCTMTLAAGD